MNAGVIPLQIDTKNTHEAIANPWCSGNIRTTSNRPSSGRIFCPSKRSMNIDEVKNKVKNTLFESVLPSVIFNLSHMPNINSVNVQIGRVKIKDFFTPKRSIRGPLTNTPQHPSMVAHIYIVLNKLRDSPVVCKIGSVNAQNPIDCPGNERIITKQHIANDMHFDDVLL